MKRAKITFFILFILLAFVQADAVLAGARFEMTQSGVRYVVRDDTGQVVENLKPEYDTSSNRYVVKDREDNVIAYQPLAAEADMSQIKIVAPAQGDSHSAVTRDFLGNSVPVLRELPANDPRYQQLKGYIESDPGLRNAVSMQLEARNYKIDQLQAQLNQGVRDPNLVSWLVNDLKKPVYLEVGDSGSIYHDPKGFVLAERGPDGQIAYRDNSHANRLVIPPNSEAFQGGMQDSAAASVMAHEVGHMIMDQVYERNNYPKTNYSGPHSKDSITDQGFAISEGWAEAMETLANKDRLDSGSSWRLQSQKNIADNKYIFKNHGVLEGPNDGILKNGGQMLSTEGVNASLFYKMLTDNRIDAPYSKVVQVFDQYKPQTYNDFLKSYIEKFPEDRSYVVKQYLENTKYATVDSSAVDRFKAVHDAEQAMQSASGDQRAQLEADYQAKIDDYNQWKEQAYKQTVVDGKVDRALSGEGGLAYSDETGKQFRDIKLSETLLKSQKALGQGFEKAVDSVKNSFSVKNLAMTAGTAVAMNLASQLMQGGKVDMKQAFKAVASMQFVGNVVGSSLGAAAGQVFAPLIKTFVPIPIVGSIAGALLPTLGAIAGGRFGGDLGGGVGFKQALKNLDWVAISGQAIGSTIGSILGAMIPIPVLGPMLGGMLGGMLGEKIFSGIAKWFGYKKNKGQPANTVAVPTGAPSAVMMQDTLTIGNGGGTSPSVSDPTGVRLDASIDRIPYDKMHPNLRVVKDDYEKAYQAYAKALSGGNQTAIRSALSTFQQQKGRYQRALSAYNK